MEAGSVRLETRDKIAVITLDHPERRNAMGEAMWVALDERIAEVEAALPRAVVLTGAGDKAFCAGQDLSPDNPQVQALVGAIQNNDQGPVRTFLERERRVVDRLCALPVPLIAAVNGLAYGGGAELATRCDLRVLDPDAVICFSEVKLGLMPDWGGGVELTRMLGQGRAADLILTARKVSAAEALSLGLANRVSASGQRLGRSAGARRRHRQERPPRRASRSGGDPPHAGSVGSRRADTRDGPGRHADRVGRVRSRHQRLHVQKGPRVPGFVSSTQSPGISQASPPAVGRHQASPYGVCKRRT